ncbi:MAG: hypothetical protein ABR499_04130 [Gemmatimonadaceae bacterium]
MSLTLPDDCAPAFDPARDPPDSLYGFARAEWAEAARRAGGTIATVVAHWDRAVAIAVAGGGIGLEMATFVALASLSPEHARRAVARLEPALSRDLDQFEAACRADGSLNDAWLAALTPWDDISKWPAPYRTYVEADLRKEFADARRLLALASATESS